MSLKHRLEAWGELFKRYFDIFKFYWQRRESLNMPDFRVNEAEFMPAALAIQAKPVSPSARWLARILMALFAALLLWSFFGHTDIVVSAQGKIIPRAYTQTLASLEIAKVRAIYAQEGKKVRKGEVLLELDPSINNAEQAKAYGQWVELTLQIARAQALIEAIDQQRPPVLAEITTIPKDKWQQAQQQLLGEYQDYQARTALLLQRMKHYQALAPLNKKQLQDYQVLLEKGDVSQHQLIEKQRAFLETQNQWTESKNQLETLKTETRKNAFNILQESQKQVEAFAQDINRTTAQSQFLKITAPMDGTVHQLMVHTVGGVVPAAQPLLQVVPDQEHLEVEAMIENKDVGFVSVDQTAAIKIATFEYTKYGTILGKVTHISKDAIIDEKRGLLYSVRVGMEKSTVRVGDRDVSLAPGMAVTVDIRTGKRRIIEYVLSPIIKHQTESLRER